MKITPAVLSLAAMLFGFASTAAIITVDNFSFEDEGASVTGDWAELPAGGDWVDGNVTKWDSIYFSNGTYDPTANGFGGANNNQPQNDNDSYTGVPTGNQNYGVTYANGTAASDVGTANFIGFGFINYPDVTASAALDENSSKTRLFYPYKKF